MGLEGTSRPTAVRQTENRSCRGEMCQTFSPFSKANLIIHQILVQKHTHTQQDLWSSRSTMHEILLTYDAFISLPSPEHGITVDRLLHAGSRCGVSEVGGGTSVHIVQEFLYLDEFHPCTGRCKQEFSLFTYLNLFPNVILSWIFSWVTGYLLPFLCHFLCRLVYPKLKLLKWSVRLTRKVLVQSAAKLTSPS